MQDEMQIKINANDINIKRVTANKGISYKNLRRRVYTIGEATALFLFHVAAPLFDAE